MEKSTRPRSIHVEKTSHLVITWMDGHVSTYPLAYLQRMCTSASCGVQKGSNLSNAGGLLPILSASAVMKPVVLQVEMVGRYGIRFSYNNCQRCTGIFTFENLRQICPAENPQASPPKVVHGIQINAG